MEFLINIKKAPFQRSSVSQCVNRIGYVVLIYQLFVLMGVCLIDMLGDVFIAEQLEQVQPDGRDQPAVFASTNPVNLDKKLITFGSLTSSSAALSRSMPSSSSSPSRMITACRSL